MTDEARIRQMLEQAIELATDNVAAGGGPFGAVIADSAGSVVAHGQNRVTAARDPTAHAEVMAIREACRAVGDHRLDGLVLYSSCEPCPMCLAAAWWARLDGVWFASTRSAAAAAGFDDALLWDAMSRADTAPQLAVHQLAPAEAGAEFRAWEALEGRTPY